MQLDWEIWLNSNLSPAIAKWIQVETSFLVKSSYVLGLNGVDDITIYNKAKAYGKVILVSKDKDFALLIEALGTPPKLILIKKENCDNRILWEFIRPRIQAAISMLTDTNLDVVELE
jgi:predicted nuclease of predicted toxin-antitoxin system